MADRRLLFGGALAAVLALGACSSRAADPAPGQGRGQGSRSAGIAVQAVAVEAGTLTAQHDVAAAIVPVTQSQVAAQIGGVVSRVLHQAGDWVALGEPVVLLDDSQLQLAYKNAQAAVDTARINLTVGQDTASQADPKLSLQVQSAQSAVAAAQRNYDSQQALLKLGGATASQVDTAKSQLEQAQANVEAAKFALDQNSKAGTQNIAQLRLAVDIAVNQLQQARLNLENASIKAPFAGQVAAANVTAGMFVGQNAPAFLLVSSEREINFSVPPPDAPNLPKGTTVAFSYQARSYNVRISQAPSAPINGVVPMVADAPPDRALTFGTVGTVSYQLSLAQGILVPVAALQTNENQNFVFAVVGGKATAAPITILAETGITAAVTGIAAGTQVIVNPPPGLLEGSAVRVVGSQPAVPPGQPNGQRGAGGAAPGGTTGGGGTPGGTRPAAPGAASGQGGRP